MSDDPKIKIEVEAEGLKASADIQPGWWGRNNPTKIIKVAQARVIGEKLANGEQLEPHERALVIAAHEKEIKKAIRLAEIIAKAEAFIPDMRRMLGEPQRPQLTSGESGKPATSEDWVDRFFEDAGLVSDEQVQDVYARVAAGEYVRPGSFSRMTLGVLRELDQTTASLFQIACNLNFANGILGEVNLLRPFGLDFDKLSLLDASRLVDFKQNVGVNPSPEPGADRWVVRYGPWRLEGTPDRYHAISLYPLTLAGIELARVVATEPSFDYFKEVVRHLYIRKKSIHWFNENGEERPLSELFPVKTAKERARDATKARRERAEEDRQKHSEGDD